MPIHYDTIEDGQNKKSDLWFSHYNVSAYSTRHLSTTLDDFEPVSNRNVKFNANSDTAIGSVNITNDKSTEYVEIFEIWLANPSDGAVGEPAEATVNLYDSTSSGIYYHTCSFCFTFWVALYTPVKRHTLVQWWRHLIILLIPTRGNWLQTNPLEH